MITGRLSIYRTGSNSYLMELLEVKFQLDIQTGNNVTFNNSVTTTDLLQVGAGAPVNCSECRFKQGLLE